MSSPSGLQLSLPFQPLSVLRPAARREEPIVWVRRLALWHDFAQSPMRDVLLRRGLNIVWSPIGKDPGAVAAGHAAGKSMFCRLVRFCLGEDVFADREDAAAIRA